MCLIQLRIEQAKYISVGRARAGKVITSRFREQFQHNLPDHPVFSLPVVSDPANMGQ